MTDRHPTEAELEQASVEDERLHERILEEAGRAIHEAIRDHKRAGNPIAQWKDGRVVIIPPEEIEA